MSQVIIIIGLPGSGKTYMSQMYASEYLIFDDYISDEYNGRVQFAIRSGYKVCLNDPRLCIPDTFDIHINKILKYLDISQLHLIIFENNPEQCLINVTLRNDKRRGIEQSIINYSKLYNIKHYDAYYHTNVPVWNSS